MRCTCSIAVLAVALVGMWAATASAQMWPGRRYASSSYYDGYDSGALAAGFALNSADNAQRNVTQSYQEWSQRAASSQMSRMESGIRNTMNAGDQQYTQNLDNQQQSRRDWWFQVEQQQAAQRQAEAARYAAIPAGFEAGAAPNAPKAKTDVIKWPPLLQAPPFASERAEIEAPYRRNATGLSVPTAADYQNMIKTVEQMKATLKAMTARITAEEYFNAQGFLDELAHEARERLDTIEAKKQ